MNKSGLKLVLEFWAVILGCTALSLGLTFLGHYSIPALSVVLVLVLLAAKEQIQALINNGLKLDLYFNEDE